MQSGESIMVEVAAGPSDSSTHEKVGRCFFFLINVNTFLFYFVVSILASLSSLASHGAESAQVKFVSSGPV